MATDSGADFSQVKSSYDDVNTALENLLGNMSGAAPSVTMAQVNQAIASVVNSATANLIKSSANDSVNDNVPMLGINKAGIPWMVNGTTGTTEYLATADSASSVPVGTVLPFGSNTIPGGYLLCNGASYDTRKYSNLYSAIGSSNVPDLRGLFLRGLDPSGNIDNYGSSRALFSFEEGSMAIIGDVQQGALAGFYAPDASLCTSLGYDHLQDTSESFTTSSGGNGLTSATFDFGRGSGQPMGVVRPKNSAVNYIIKAQ